MHTYTNAPNWLKNKMPVPCVLTIRQGNAHTTTLPLEVFTQRNSVEVEFYFLKLLFEPPLGGLRSNVCTPSKARWTACGRLPIRHN